MALARISFASRLNKKSYAKHVQMCSTVHDSIVADAPEEFSQPLTNLAHEVFRDLPDNIKKCWKYEWETPLDCEVLIGRDMKNMSLILPS